MPAYIGNRFHFFDHGRERRRGGETAGDARIREELV
jgi:hypothetical protein